VLQVNNGHSVKKGQKAPFAPELIKEASRMFEELFPARQHGFED